MRLAGAALSKAAGAALSVRGSFMQGQQLSDQSYFFDHSHVQIAALDPDAVASNFQIEDGILLAQHDPLARLAATLTRIVRADQ